MADLFFGDNNERLQDLLENMFDYVLTDSDMSIKTLFNKVTTNREPIKRVANYVRSNNTYNSIFSRFKDYEKLSYEMKVLEFEGTLLPKISDNFKIVHTFSESTLPSAFKFTVIESKINNRWYLIVNSTDGLNNRVGIGLSSDSHSEILDELNKTVTKLTSD